MIKMTWYGTAALLFEDEKDRFVIDPFLKLLPESTKNKHARKLRIEAFLSCNKILLTHGHFDHMGSLPLLYSDKDVKIYTTEHPAKNLLLSGGFHETQLHMIAPGDKIKIGSCEIICHKGKHVQYDFPLICQVLYRSISKQLKQLWYLLRENSRFPEYGETISYEIRYQDLQIFVMGSADLAPDTSYPTGIDILILPHQGRSDITAHNLRLLQRLRPAQVYIDHYDNAFPPLTYSVDCRPLMTRIHQIMPEIKIQRLRERETITLSANPKS